MLFKIYSLICLFLIKFFIQPTTCALPPSIQNLEFDDITSLWDKFPLIIDKIKEAVSRFRCPKGWKRLGGSCFYLSNLTSTSIHANYTCNLLHSNLSNLIQIRNAVELFYTAHVLSRNNLSSLMIEIDSNLLKGKKITDILMNDQGRWERMKENFRDVRLKYFKLKQKIVDRLSAIGLRILRRSKKIKQITSKEQEQYIHDNIDFDQYDEYEFDHKELNNTNLINSNETSINISSLINDDDEYEYDDLDSPDETDEFEKIDDIRGICNDIHWNVLDNNSTVFILTTYIMSDKIVCSLSDVEPNTKYHHICEYVLDFCFANILCGKHGRCVNTLAGFKCSCSFLYGGLLCEKISEHGHQIIVSVVIITILSLLSFKWVRCLLAFLAKFFCRHCKHFCKKRQKKKLSTNDDKQKLVQDDRLDNNGGTTNAINLQQASETYNLQQRRRTMADEIMEFFLPKTSNPLLNPVKRNLVRNIWVGSLSIFFLSLLFVITTIMYFMSFGYNIIDDKDEQFAINHTIRLVTQCESISDYRRGNLIFAPFAFLLILIFSWSMKREKLCLKMFDGRPALLPPIEPFRTGNRFTTATVFGILAFEVLKIFEELVFSTGQPLVQGVLVELLERIALVILIGLRYYPVLASLQLRNIVARFFACLYIIGDIIYTIVREGSCMGYLPLSGHYSTLEEAKLRRELGTWFIIYGLIKNIPHFFFLSYIGAELCVRFSYDSIYVPLKKNQTIWSAPIVQLDESEFSKYYVTKLFRRNHPSYRITDQENPNIDKMVDYEYEIEQQNEENQSYFKRFINFIYHSDDDFRFTTIATCTYTVAIVFLYYLACTFVFFYVARTTGHISFLRFFVESAFNVELGAFSLNLEIILSAIFTVIIYSCQLFIGMQNYKKHKLELYKGIYISIPSSSENFTASTIASYSVHYSGFLVGYMAWGFVICFHLILFILIGIRLLSLQIRHIEIALTIIVPILIIYLLKMVIMRSAGNFFLIQKMDKKFNLKNRKTYAMFVYFSFFADCFLGIASCIIRLIKATFLNVVFMARLDWSFLGRPLEKFDLGFAAYVSYLHMEVAYTNPVMLAFCYSLYDDIIQRRPKQNYDDECCIAPSELDDEALRQNRTNLTQTLPSVKYIQKNNNDNGSIQDTSNPNGNEPTSKRTSHRETELKNSSIISIEENHMNRIETTKQSSLGFLPAVPPREDLPSGHNTSENETDEDGGLKPESFSTITKIISSKQLTLNNQKTKQDSSSDNTYDSTITSSKRQKDITSTSYDTIGEIVPKLSDNTLKTKRKKTIDKHHDTTVQIEEEHATQTTAFYSPPSYNLATNPTNLHYLRTISYREAQHKTPPLISHRLHISSIPHSHNNTNDTIPLSFNNRSYSKIGLIQASSSHSNQQQISGEQNQNEDINVENEEGVYLLASRSTFIPKESTDISAENTLIKSEEDKEKEEKEEKERIKRRKRSRFRWHFLYTLINNYHLFDLRKQVQSRLACLHVQRSNLIDEQQFSTTITVPQPETTEYPTGDRFRPQGGGIESPTSDTLTAKERRSPVLHRLISVPVSVSNDYPSSPAERYIAIRAQMLYDANIQQPNIPYGMPMSPTSIPTTVSPSNPQLRPPINTTISDQSLGFHISPDIIVQPPSESSVQSKKKQTVSHLTSHIIQQDTITPSLFQPASASNQSTADYPLATSSVVNSATLRSQMSHDQHMRVWRRGQVEKIQKKQRHCYIYGQPPQPPVVDRVSTAAILTPQIISTTTKQQQVPPTPNTGKTQREPTPSRFRFPPPSSQVRNATSSIINDTQLKTNNQKTKINRRQQEISNPLQTMDRLDEDPHETSNTNKSLEMTSTLIHREDSPDSTTDITEI